jgi:hypothetical protein
MDTMDGIYRNVCGLAVHKKTVGACGRRLRPGATGEKEVKSFGTTTAALQTLLAWGREWEVSHVAMESTGV